MEKRGPVVMSTIVRQNVGSPISRLLVAFSTQDCQFLMINEKQAGRGTRIFRFSDLWCDELGWV